MLTLFGMRTQENGMWYVGGVASIMGVACGGVASNMGVACGGVASNMGVACGRCGQ